MTPQNALRILQASPLFQNVPSQIIQNFIEQGQIETAGPDEKIIEEGSSDRHFFFLLEGMCAVTKSDPSPNPVYLANIYAGETFGEAGVFTEHVRTANVMATESVAYLKISQQQIFEFLKNDPAHSNIFLFHLLEEIINRLKMTTQELQIERVENTGSSYYHKTFA